MVHTDIPMSTKEFLDSIQRYYHSTIKYVEKHETTDMHDASKNLLGVAYSWMEKWLDEKRDGDSLPFYPFYLNEFTCNISAEKSILVELTSRIIDIDTTKGLILELHITEAINLLAILKHLSFDKDRQSKLWYFKQKKQKKLGNIVDNIILKLIFAYKKNSKKISIKGDYPMSISDIKKLNKIL